MRWVWNALPWEELDRLTLLTLTYPADWRKECPDGATLKRHLRAFRERWRRKWGTPRGVWVLEFQPRSDRPPAEQFAPHFHLYVGLPADAELWHDGNTGGKVWDWARQAWWEVVRSDDVSHRYRGLHVRPCFYGSYADRDDVKRVGDYFWRESGKLQQKVAPDGFEGVKRWDVWGMRPSEVCHDVSQDEFIQMRRVLRRKRDQVTGTKVRIRDRSGNLVPRRRERSLDGLSVTNLSDGFAFSDRLVRWAQEESKRPANQGRKPAQKQPRRLDAKPLSVRRTNAQSRRPMQPNRADRPLRRWRFEEPRCSRQMQRPGISGVSTTALVKMQAWRVVNAEEQRKIEAQLRRKLAQPKYPPIFDLPQAHLVKERSRLPHALVMSLNARHKVDQRKASMVLGVATGS